MPIATKAGLFAPELAQLAAWGGAISHPARLQIIQVLARRGECICGQLVEELPLAQASVSRHLKALKRAGLIRGEVDGPRSCYCLDYEVLNSMRDQLKRFLDAVPESGDDLACCEPVSGTSMPARSH